MEIKLIPQEIEYKAFQFALFNRKVIFSNNTILFKSRIIHANDVVAFRYSKINKIAGNRVAKTYYKVELKDKNNISIKIHFSHMVSQGKPEVLEKVYFELINALNPVVSNLYYNSISYINEGQTLEIGNIKINNSGVEIRSEFLFKGAKIPWERFEIKYQNGTITIYDGIKAITSYNFYSTWNLKLIEDICRKMKAESQITL